MGGAMAAWAAGGADALREESAEEPYGAVVRAVVPRVTDPVTAELRSPSDCAEAALGAAAAPCLAPFPLPDPKTAGGKARKVMYTVEGAYIVFPMFGS